MKTSEALLLLENNRHRNATFVSDPDNGDHIQIHDEGQESVSDLLIRLDFEAYEGDGPQVTIL